MLLPLFYVLFCFQCFFLILYLPFFLKLFLPQHLAMFCFLLLPLLFTLYLSVFFSLSVSLTLTPFSSPIPLLFLFSLLHFQIRSFFFHSISARQKMAVLMWKYFDQFSGFGVLVFSMIRLFRVFSVFQFQRRKPFCPTLKHSNLIFGCNILLQWQIPMHTLLNWIDEVHKYIC